jgi:hypothetical protein
MHLCFLVSSTLFTPFFDNETISIFSPFDLPTKWIIFLHSGTYLNNHLELFS